MIREKVKNYIFGKYVITSINRDKNSPYGQGNHYNNRAIDIVPENLYLNLVIGWLFWPGGFGYKIGKGAHLHYDIGRKRRWKE